MVDPDSQFLPKYLALAKAHPDSPRSLDALAFVIMRGGYHTGDVYGEPWRNKEEALDLVSERHMSDPRIGELFTFAGGGLPSKKSQAFLRRAFETGPNETTRAAAGLALANSLHELGHSHARSRQIKSQSKVANSERFWRLVCAPYLDENFPYDAEALTQEIENVLARVLEKYPDIKAIKVNWARPNRGLLEIDTTAKSTTYGALAKALLFEHRGLAPGKPAPEIAGTDAAGVQFSLSDYRGKVVLLTFSANWCGGCVQLYPLQRKLVERLRDEPFVLLSVSMDETVDTLKSSTVSGDITWRCWWDGMDGPIRKAWNVTGAPTIYLVDQRGIIQDSVLNRNTPLEEFERAIKSALRGTSPSDRSSN
jgi:peroxiredoxin